MPSHPLTPRTSDSDWAAIKEALQIRQVPLPLQAELRDQLAGQFDGLLLYGSWARGDADADSDLDVLALNFRGSTPSRQGRVSLAVYAEADLQGVSGTLFGYHLVRDGMLLLDREARLSNILARIGAPNPKAVIDRIRSLTPVLDVSHEDRAKYIEGLTQVARYLLRSALYAEGLDRGEPCFSVREIADLKQDPDLVTVLSSHEAVRPKADRVVFNDLQARLSSAVGPLLPNPFGDLHGLIEGAWEFNRELSNFATLALSDGTDELPYDELPKVTL